VLSIPLLSKIAGIEAIGQIYQDLLFPVEVKVMLMVSI
jgi:hypothetical protein